MHVLLEDRIEVAYKLLQFNSALKLNEEAETIALQQAGSIVQVRAHPDSKNGAPKAQ